MVYKIGGRAGTGQQRRDVCGLGEERDTKKVIKSAFSPK